MLFRNRVEKTFVVYPGALFSWWEVHLEGSEDSRTFEHERDAVAYAKRVASAQPPSKVVLEDWYGGQQEEWSFGQADGTSATLKDDPDRPAFVLR